MYVFTSVNSVDGLLATVNAAMDDFGGISDSKRGGGVPGCSFGITAAVEGIVGQCVCR